METGKDAPKFTDEDLKIISSPLDFVGINVYLPRFYVLASDEAPGWHEVPYAKGHAKAPISHFPIGPEALYWAPKHVQERAGHTSLAMPQRYIEGDSDAKRKLIALI